MEEESRQQWELTVGIEIHAQLDTESKLFSCEFFLGGWGGAWPLWENGEGHTLTAGLTMQVLRRH